MGLEAKTKSEKKSKKKEKVKKRILESIDEYLDNVSDTLKTPETSSAKAKKKAKEATKKAKKKAKETIEKAKRAGKKTKEKYKQAKKKMADFYDKTLEKIKDPKLRKKLKKVLKYLYEEYEEKREQEKEKERDKKEIEKSDKLEYYKYEEPINAKKGEVLRAAQIICVNTHAIVYDLERTNDEGEKYLSTNRLGKELKGLGIKPNILKGSIALFKDGVGDYASFKERMKILDSEGDLDNATEILMRCAIGKYQIIPRHHFGRVKGWNTKGKEFQRKMMYIFLRNETAQGKIAQEIIEDLNARYHGDPYVMAAAYYAGGKGARAMKKYRDAVKRGEITEIPSLEKKQAYGYGSILKDYAEPVVRYQKIYQNRFPDKTFLETFQMAIAKKESGDLRNKRIKK